jgi:hypothetical protein
MIFQSVDIDSAVYPEEFQGVYKTCLKWLFKNPDIYIIIEDAKTKSSKQFAEYVQKMKQQEHESAVDELLSRYQNDVVVTETQNNDKKGFFSRLKDSLKLFG